METLKNLFQQFSNAVKDELGFVIAIIIFTAALIALAFIGSKKSKTGTGFSKTHTLTLTGVFAAIAAILMYIEFPLPFAPDFYKIDLSEVPVIISGLTLGPIAAASTELIKILIRLMLKPTSTAFVGEFANLIIGLSFVIPISIIYQFHKSKRGLITALTAGTGIMTFTGAFMNAFILLPAYAYLYGGIPVSALINIGSAVNPAIKNMTTFIILAVTPFNIFKGFIVSLVVILIYSRIKILLKLKNN